MNRLMHPTRCATAAIAAALALGSTALTAQVAFPENGPATIQPAPVQPAPVQAAPTPPTVIVPPSDLIPVTPPSATVPQQIPAPTTVAPVRTTAETPATRQTTRTTAPTATTRQAQRTPVAANPEPTTADTIPETEPFAPEVETVFVPPVELAPGEAPEAAPSRATTDLYDLAGYATALFLLLAVVVFIARRPRKAKRHAAAAAKPQPLAVQPERRDPVPVADPLVAASLAAAAPTLATPTWQQNTVAPMASYRREPVTGTGGKVALPRRIPTDHAERDALLKRLVAAAPDRANPFRSHKARVHRARLIIQSIGHHFNDRDPWIDLSGYPEVWPEVANRKFPHAA